MVPDTRSPLARSASSLWARCRSGREVPTRTSTAVSEALFRGCAGLNQNANVWRVLDKYLRGGEYLCDKRVSEKTLKIRTLDDSTCNGDAELMTERTCRLDTRDCHQRSSLFRGVVCLAMLQATACPPSDVYGWGATGHRTVGQIAEWHLSTAAAREVKALLGRESLAEAATYPDEIRSDPKYKETAPWHYVTIEDGETYETSERNPKGDAVEAIRRFVATLRSQSSTKKDKVYALRWLVHLVGDIHQPLHVGRGADRGGNTIEVKWFEEDTNLHSVWDDKMIDSTKLSFTELSRFTDKASKEEIRKWQDSIVLDWVQESIAYRDQVYTVPESNKYGTYKYSYENLPLAKLRLNQAGVRLAGLLNQIYSGSGDE